MLFDTGLMFTWLPNARSTEYLLECQPIWVEFYCDCRTLNDGHDWQGGEGDCFYVVGSGEFEVLATQVCISIFIKLSTYLSFLRSEGRGLVADHTM